MSTTAKGQSPRAARAERPRSSKSSASASHPPSRSSSRYPSLKMAPQPGSEASHSRASSPGLRPVHPPLTSRQPQRKGSMGSVNGDRPPTPASKGSIKDSQHSSQHGPQSSLLQEKLQRERRSEIQRNLSRLAGEMGAATEPKAAVATPTRSATADGQRGDCTQDSVGDGKKQGPALKEMEQTMTTLHKQNFDLKLELFHRRGRQAALEEKVEALEAEQARTKQACEELIQELDKREKAIEEAVHMIVSLEARIDLLLRDREMVRQLDMTEPLGSRRNGAMSPATTGHEETLTQDEPLSSGKRDNALARMPSFLSERTENTETLRSVYLNTQGSFLSLSKTDPRSDNNGYVSPSMSILSETSFLSIYGKGAGRDTSSQPNMQRSIPGWAGGSGQRSISMPSKVLAPNKFQENDRLGSRDGAKEAIENGDTTSPLQKLASLEDSPVLKHSGSRSGRPAKESERSTIVKPFKPQPLLRVKNDRDRPARKVLTDDPVSNHHKLPPTPDTMTTSSMLSHQSQVIDDPPRRDRTASGTTYPALSKLTLDQKDRAESDQWRFKPADISQRPSVTAFTGRQDSSGAAYYEHRLPILRRPRSADETTISRQKMDWDSCSEGDDACSDASSFDYWIKEGLRPSRGGAARPPARFGPSQAYYSNEDAPEFFGFPSNDEDWQLNNAFGALHGNGHVRAGAPIAPTLDSLGDSLPSPETGLFGSGLAGSVSPRPDGTVVAPPSAPQRQSSLHARTSAPGTPMIERTPGLSSRNHSIGGSARKRSVSSHVYSSPTSNGYSVSNNSCSQTPTTPSQMQHPQQDNPSQRRHYPPHANSQPQTAARPRSRGLTSLFRRSLGSTTLPPQPSASVPATGSPFAPPANKDVSPYTVGVPSWEHRSDLAHEDTSATPPPIMRRKVPGVSMGIPADDTETGPTGAATPRAPRPATTMAPTGPGLGAGLGRVMAAHDGGGAPLTPTPGAYQNPDQEGSTAQANHQGHGRRWFNLSRVTSLKHGGA